MQVKNSEVDTLGGRIRVLRNVFRKSQIQIAHILGVETAVAVSKYETNQRTPDMSKLLTLAEYFCVSFDWLCNGKTQNNAGPKLGRARNRAGLSIAKAACLLDTPEDFLKAIEETKFVPSQKFLSQMCALYKCNMYEVFDETINNVPVHTSTGDAKIDYLIVKHRVVLALLEETPEAEGYIIDYLKGLVAHKGMKNLLTEEKPDGKT